MTRPTASMFLGLARPPMAGFVGSAAVLCGLVLCGLVLTGCHSARSASSSRGEVAPPPPASAWPERDLDAVRGFQQRTPGVIYRWEPSGALPDDEITDERRALLEQPERVMLHNALTDHGLLRHWVSAEPDGLVNLFFSGFGGRYSHNGSFLTSRDAVDYRVEDATRDLPDRLGEPRPELDLFRSGLQSTYQARAVLLSRGLDLHIPNTPGDRGLLVVLGGLFSTEWQERVIDRLADLGWGVLQIDPATSIRAPNDREEFVARRQQSDWFRDQLKIRMDAARAANPDDDPSPSYDEMKAISDEGLQRFPSPPGGFELTPETDPEELGMAIARAVDDGVAENAYATAAAVAYLAQRDGASGEGIARHRPLVLLGFSAGSLSMPAVAAKLREEGYPPDAMVLVGAGANIFDIAQRSTLARGSIRLSPPNTAPPPADRVALVNDAYLAHTALDPYAVAPSLRDLPTLLVLASDDQAVPNGDLLDERLGYPERVTYHGGHGGLFFFLPGKVTTVARWLDREAPAQSGPFTEGGVERTGSAASD